MSQNRDKPKDNLRRVKERNLKRVACWQLIAWLNENRSAGSANKKLYREACRLVRELQAMHAHHVRQSKLAEEFTAARLKALYSDLGRTPIGFFPWVNAYVLPNRRVVAEPKSGLGWSKKHPFGQPTIYMSDAWRADAIELVRQCWACQEWYFGRSDRDTCSDRCRQIKSRQTRGKE